MAAPPPPPGSDLASWASLRGYQLDYAPDLAWWQRWGPFSYLRPATHVSHELRFEVGEAKISVGQVFPADDLGRMLGHTRALYFFVQSEHLRARASARSKLGRMSDDVTRELNEFGRMLSNAFSKAPAPAPPVLGDHALALRCDVAFPSPEEGAWALTPSLRSILTSPQFRGIVEIRVGVLAVQLPGYDIFEPRTLDLAIPLVGQIYAAAVSGAALAASP